MPIYAYRCDACGHRKDVLQKMADPALTICPSCGAESFAKQLSAPAFQLKGTGWYVTDFRDNGKKADAEGGKIIPAGESGSTEGKDAATGKDGAERKSDAKPDGKSDGSAGGKSDGSPAPAPVPAAAPAKPAGKAEGASGSTSSAGGSSAA